MPNTFTTTGGARVGSTNATWPLAQLLATPDNLTLSIRLLGNYSFTPDKVVSVERYVLIPFLGWGVQIHHCQVDCPQRVIFWCLGNPDGVLRGIRDSGFVPIGSASNFPQRSGMAIRWSAVIIGIVVWNALFVLNFYSAGKISPRPGPFILVALFLAFAISVGTLILPKLQRLILKPGREIGEIRPHLRLLAFISGFMLVTFSILLASGAFNHQP
jgi:hypothetical protein